MSKQRGKRHGPESPESHTKESTCVVVNKKTTFLLIKGLCQVIFHIGPVLLFCHNWIQVFRALSSSIADSPTKTSACLSWGSQFCLITLATHTTSRSRVCVTSLLAAAVELRVEKSAGSSVGDDVEKSWGCKSVRKERHEQLAKGRREVGKGVNIYFTYFSGLREKRHLYWCCILCRKQDLGIYIFDFALDFELHLILSKRTTISTLRFSVKIEAFTK